MNAEGDLYAECDCQPVLFGIAEQVACGIDMGGVAALPKKLGPDGHKDVIRVTSKPIGLEGPMIDLAIKVLEGNEVARRLVQQLRQLLVVKLRHGLLFVGRRLGCAGGAVLGGRQFGNLGLGRGFRRRDRNAAFDMGVRSRSIAVRLVGRLLRLRKACLGGDFRGYQLVIQFSSQRHFPTPFDKSKVNHQHRVAMYDNQKRLSSHRRENKPIYLVESS